MTRRARTSPTAFPSTVETTASGAAFIIELTCLDCSRPIADIPAPRSLVEVGLKLQRLPWHRLRCRVCGGAAVVNDLVPRRRQELPLDWTSDRPRRGRPPKGVFSAVDPGDEKTC
jgi:hypothetical protein